MERYGLSAPQMSPLEILTAFIAALTFFMSEALSAVVPDVRWSGRPRSFQLHSSQATVLAATSSVYLDWPVAQVEPAGPGRTNPPPTFCATSFVESALQIGATAI